jgi:hypothetical protein
MAITIDQFLRDLTERELLSAEEAHAVRRELTANAPKRAGADQSERGSTSPGSSTGLADVGSLILCDCLIQDKLQDEEQQLIFHAQRLKDDSAVTIQVLLPGIGEGSTAGPARLNGSAAKAGSASALSKGITDVGRHGEMVFVCCEDLEAETLEQVVLQNGTLPLELATETLLQTARTLKRLQEQGLSLHEVTPELLLLDEDGKVHLTGNHHAEPLRSTICQCAEHDPPIPRLFESLGKLFAFLQTGEMDAISSLSPSVKRVYLRLLSREGSQGYNRWDELIQDLESLLDGRDLSAPDELAPAERTEPISSAAATTPAATSNHALRWGIALALFAAVIVAIITALKD